MFLKKKKKYCLIRKFTVFKNCFFFFFHLFPLFIFYVSKKFNLLLLIDVLFVDLFKFEHSEGMYSKGF